MSALKGLAAYKARKDSMEADRNAAAARREEGSANFFKLVRDGDSAVVRFAQEIDPDATGYTEAAGLGYVNIEHRNPDKANGWKNKANCSTESQGACLPCEYVADRDVEWNDKKGWKQKEQFYVNVIAGPSEEIEFKGKTHNLTTSINQSKGEGEVYLLAQSTWKGIYDQLAEYAMDDETILDTYFKITRKGDEFNNTSYILTKGKAVPAGAKDLSEYTLVDIENVINKEIPYAQQEAFYWRGVDRPGHASATAEPNRELVSVGTTSASDEW